MRLIHQPGGGFRRKKTESREELMARLVDWQHVDCVCRRNGLHWDGVCGVLFPGWDNDPDALWPKDTYSNVAGEGKVWLAFCLWAVCVLLLWQHTIVYRIEGISSEMLGQTMRKKVGKHSGGLKFHDWGMKPDFLNKCKYVICFR